MHAFAINVLLVAVAFDKSSDEVFCWFCKRIKKKYFIRNATFRFVMLYMWLSFVKTLLLQVTSSSSGVDTPYIQTWRGEQSKWLSERFLFHSCVSPAVLRGCALLNVFEQAGRSQSWHFAQSVLAATVTLFRWLMLLHVMHKVFFLRKSGSKFIANKYLLLTALGQWANWLSVLPHLKHKLFSFDQKQNTFIEKELETSHKALPLLFSFVHHMNRLQVTLKCSSHSCWHINFRWGVYRIRKPRIEKSGRNWAWALNTVTLISLKVAICDLTC